MSQALYTSMSGINAATTSISVVSNNVANINTTAFKSADARFENLFSKTYTTGNSPTKTAGGINPKQIGMGVEVGSIVRNFTEGTYVSTGRTEDLMISGGGYFTVMDSAGEIFYTRDGSFTLDAEGNMVSQSGMYVLGAAQIYNTSASQTKINIPKTIKTSTVGNTSMGTAIVKDLNDASITAGTFNIKFTDNNTTKYAEITIEDADLEGSLDALITKINKQIQNAGMTTTVGGNQVQQVVASITSDGTLQFKSQPSYNKDVALKGGSHKVDGDGDANNGKTINCYAFKFTTVPAGLDANKTYYATGSTGGSLYELVNNTYVPVKNGGNIVTVTNSAAVHGTDGEEYEITETSLGAVTGGTNKVTTGTFFPEIDFTAGTSNFLEQTRLATAEANNGVYTSKVLDYTVKVEPVAALSEAVNLESYSVGTDGAIEATYSNGDHLTVEANQDDNTFEWKYTTSNGVVIRGADKIDINPNIADTSGFVLQLATVTNEAGLVSQNNNLWSIGPNTGDTVYAVGGSMGIGQIQTGGLEGSNVDLSRELSNMILAQRAIQANSRVFSTASSIMETLSYLGN